MSITKEVKKDLISKFSINDKDTGSAEIQIAVQTERINNLIEHAPHTKLISTTKSGHYIHYSEPTIVIDAIIEMIENVKRK